MDILINEPDGFPTTAVQVLSQVGAVHFSDRSYPTQSIEAVFIRLRDRIGRAFHDKHPCLRYIVSPTTGLNHIDTEYFESVGVSVLSLKGRTDFLENIHATAEHTLALTLALIRRLPFACSSVLQGEWNRYPFQGTELFGKRVMLVGYGRLGRQVETLFRAFGCKVYAYDIDRRKVPNDVFLPLEEGLSTGDVISIHVNLDKSTNGFFNLTLLSKIKLGAILINTSRGELLDQESVWKLLACGHLAGAALDVLIGEPAPLTDTVRAALSALGDRIIVTPHISGFTVESLRTVEEYAAELLVTSFREHSAS